MTPAVYAMHSIISTRGRVGREMAEKLRLVEGHVLDADGEIVAPDWRRCATPRYFWTATIPSSDATGLANGAATRRRG
jgi:hypothetical protein